MLLRPSCGDVRVCVTSCGTNLLRKWGQVFKAFKRRRISVKRWIGHVELTRYGEGRERERKLGWVGFIDGIKENNGGFIRDSDACDTCDTQILFCSASVIICHPVTNCSVSRC